MLLRLKMKILENFPSQVSFAISCKRDGNWISRIIRGRDIPNQRDRVLICQKLGVEDEKEIFGN